MCGLGGALGACSTEGWRGTERKGLRGRGPIGVCVCVCARIDSHKGGDLLMCLFLVANVCTWAQDNLMYQSPNVALSAVWDELGV
jgi:hypothetical protein